MFGGIVSTSQRYMASGSAVFAPSSNATVGDVGREQDVEALERRGVLLLDDRPYLLRLPVVGVVVAGRQRVRAEHDAAPGLGAEAVPPSALVHVGEV